MPRCRAARAAAEPRAAAADAWLGVAPFFVFALLFLILPTLYLMVGAFQDADGDFTLREHRQPVHSRRSSAPTGSRSRSASPRRSLGAVIGFCHRLRRRAAAACRSWIRSAADDLLRRRLEFRRRAAGLRLPRHARPTRPGHRAAAQVVRHQPLRAPASTCCSFWGLTLTYLYFQIPLMVLIIDAGARRAEARMARGRRDPRRHAPGSTGAMVGAAGPVAEPPRHASCCSSPTPSAPSPPPTR